MKRSILFFICVVVKLVRLDNLDNKVEAECINNCPLQNHTEDTHYSYSCNYNCNINQCAKGCKLWRKALKQTCHETCNGTSDRLSSKELYCVMGCNDAITKYFSHLRAILGKPPAPALLADSLNATFLKLEWNFPQAVELGLNSHVQWKYEKMFSTRERNSWQYCQNAFWDKENNLFYVDGLEPYTKYRFRIAMILTDSGHHTTTEPIFSSESVIISTLPFGLPASPPQNVRATPVDATSITISWEPGLFPHGPILSYVLNITDNQQSEVKDIPPDNSFVMVRDVKPSQNYTIEIRMRNKRGSGPPAKVQVTTPAEPQTKEIDQLSLILGTQYNIFELTRILGEPNNIYSSTKKIKGMGFHINKKLIFVVDSEGYVSRMSMEKNSKSKVEILKPHNLDFVPLDVTVDWLNNYLYILGEMKYQISRYIIKRCDLNGGSLTVAYADLSKKPSCMQVDPINGYLFWTIQDYNKGGLYCMDISDISNGIRHEVKIKRILNETELGAFTFEHQNFNILISFQRTNTIMSTTMDGKELKDIRSSVTAPMFHKVTSIATANKKFFWTDGHDVFYEEYYEGNQEYFHNTIPHVSNNSYNKVFVNSQSSQPWPIPINPPTNLEAIFGREIAKTRWQPPHLLGFQGKGAWQNWSYEITLKEVGTEEVFSYKNINSTFFTIPNLKENTHYVLQVAAYTTSGKSPFSSEFRGSTLNASKNPIILWSAEEGLLKSNAAGEHIETLIHQNGVHYIDIAWFKHQIYLVANDSNVYWYNTTTKQKGRIEYINSVGSIAVDWIGAKLYWAKPKQQLIFRSNLEGTEKETLLISVLAKELRIDSIKAYLYWSTGYKVECSRLNGFEKFEYHDVQYFSGKQIMGLTLDVEEKLVYWIVRGSEGSKLYKAAMRGYKDDPVHVQLVSSVQKSNIQGPVCYFHKRLLWLQDDENAAISDLSGKNIATINGKHIKGLNMIHVVDSSLYMLPDGVDPWTVINVIPEHVNTSLVKVVGTSESFNISWKPIGNVNYGKVFYEVLIDKLSPIITTECSIEFPEKITPYTVFSVSIRSFTYWGTSRPTNQSIQIHSPSSTPTEPLNLRTFIEYENRFPSTSDLVSVIVRWDPPRSPNGILRGYEIRCWYNDNETETDICNGVINEANQTEYRLSHMDKHQIYFFQVVAFTEIGSGSSSKTVSVSAANGLPLPEILASSNDSIFIYDVDVNSTKIVLKNVVNPVKINYFMNEKWLVWINQKHDLVHYDIPKSTLSKLGPINGQPLALTLDWLERSLYYAEFSNGTTIYKVDLNYAAEDLHKIQILKSTNKILVLEVSPFTKSLYWLEVVQNKSVLMHSHTDGTDSGLFFKTKLTTKDYSKPCNCTNSFLEIEPSFALDHSSNPFEPSVLFLDKVNHNVVSADSAGCTCKIIADSHLLRNTKPIRILKADLGMTYWSNQDGLRALDRNHNKLFTTEVKLSDMVIYGQHVQPYPSKKCLGPKQLDNYTVTLVSNTSTSLKLQMPQTAVYEDCSNISMPTVKYTLYFSKYDENFDCIKKNTCETATTFFKTTDITGLKPFTKYMISVAVSNSYSERKGVIIGPPVILQTAPGAPSKPLNISVINLTPSLIHVTWLPPEQLNGIIIYYEVHWQTDNIVSALRQKGELSVTDSETLSANLNKLSPNETYIVWVRAYSETNETSSESDRVRITTYPEPDSIVLVNKTAYSLELSWNVTPYAENYTVEYAPIASPIWTVANIVTENNNTVKILVDNLKPKRHYKFRLVLLYKNNTELYTWPLDSRFTFETNGDRPSPPGVPIIQYVKSNVYKVYWEASEDNGAPIEEYKLEGKVVRYYRVKRSTNRTAPYYLTSPSVELEDEPDWEVFYNGTDTSWIIDGLDEQLKYVFRISARNAYGWSNTSEESNEFDMNEAARVADKQNPMKLIVIATGVPISLCAFVVLVLTYVICSSKDKQKKLQPAVYPTKPPDVELATLRELPRRGVHNTNILYNSAKPVPEELTLLPQIKRDQITLNKFLGSGAFGEVFEGKAKGIRDEMEMKVAIKTLKKGTSEQEKNEFLQEAQLMSHFKHEHILQLLGVCLDNDPPFIIMELMEGGDLLTYLRNSRSASDNTPSLTLLELLKMCVDVAKGCKYLEQMHFVHRDLACRNCLVSSCDKEYRIVKIGDFGLARDIYKNDYYRKEGEGLLPVRWMAPESLVDGVFTSQSDVWAFGVLLWEIMTLGQQPYPARANLEVLHYVRRGGRLGKPIDCPEDLYNLMLKCWEFEPEKRPTFKYCLDILDELHRRTLRNPTTAAHEGQYISTVIERNAWKSDTEDESNKEKTPFLPTDSAPGTPVSKEIPKYIEVIYEPSPPKENDGYEVPKNIVQKKLTIRDSKNKKES